MSIRGESQPNYGAYNPNRSGFGPTQTNIVGGFPPQAHIPAYPNGMPGVNPQMAQFYSAPVAPTPNNYEGGNFQPPVSYNNYPGDKKDRKFSGKRVVAGIAGLALVSGGVFVGYKIAESSGVIGKEQVISGAECYDKVADDESNLFNGAGANLSESLDVHGAVMDSDGDTWVMGYTPEQREYIKESYDQISSQYAKGHEQGGSMADLAFVVFNNENIGTPEQQTDGMLNDGYSVCVTFGGKDMNWEPIIKRESGYKEGDVPADRH